MRGTCGEQIKPIEFRSRPTRIIGERFHIYASKQWAAGKLLLEGCVGKPEIRNQKSESNPNSEVRIVGDNIEAAGDGPEPWMLELARMLILKDLPTGVIVGSASITQVVRGDALYEWHLTDVERAKRLRKPTRQPQPVWFQPFGRG